MSAMMFCVAACNYKLVAAGFGRMREDGVASNHNNDKDAEDADTIIARSIDALRLAGVSGSIIASVLQARAVFLWRQDGLTDDQIVGEFGACIQVPLGRNASPSKR